MVARPVQEFMRIEAAGSILLLLATVAALVWANASHSYDTFWHTPITIEIGSWTLSESLQHWVNDALMVIFFFVVGLEIKYELVQGDLRDPRSAALPMIAAVGGMLVPAGIYAAINAGGDGSAGWGIPMATDIAFAVGVLGVLGRRIPGPARLFLLTLAVVDDIGAILVIAVFYTSDLSLPALALAIAGLLVMVAMRVMRVWNRWAYVVVGVGVWLALLSSGVHATLAGVAIGLLTPAMPLLKEEVARRYAVETLRDDHLDPEEIARLRFLLDGSVPTVELLQSRLHPLSAYVVLPLFALANAGVALSLDGLGKALTSEVGLGIIVGLVVGKPLGILLFTVLAVKLGVGRLPEGTTWPMVVGLGAVAGVGFTVSIFIASLSFPGAVLLTDAAKVGIIAASVLAALVGVIVLLVATRHVTPEDQGDDLPEPQVPNAGATA
ncbi:Na+/H+ antiporter NhaA [Nocardioides jishulii]|uniref:Na(+)/H(+) antiporter NhaA n=1 Tax=Nocardioides jishulii TaxID=2575440 RepID=A0A4V5TKS8_9ACTN|nr:Na+/H+ antiporter NhaA [Nocardioides jishulii]TKI64903.1 Na+/H+ antiporter NhaA [Nocardioides jishulii]